MAEGTKIIDRRALQAEAEARKAAKQKELEIQAAEEEVRNAQLYGSEQDVYAAEAKLAKLKGEDYTPPVVSGNVQNTEKDVVKSAIADYNSKSGTFDNFYKTLHDAGYNDDSIETIMVDNNINGEKAQEWLNERRGKRAAAARGETPPEDYAKAKSEMETQKNAAAGKNIENKTVEVGGVAQVDPVENQFESQATEDKQTEEQSSTDEQPQEQSSTDEQPQDSPDAKNFWKKWRAGALRAYPMLQSIGDAISRNARMTADRAALLTGGQRDTGAYDPIQIQEMTPEQRTQLAFADAEAGNYDTLKQAIMAGTIDIDNAAQALNTTPESLQERFNRSERSDEADVTGKEMSNEQAAQQLDQSNEAMITSINQQIAANNEAIRALRNPDESWDNYSKAANAVLGAVSGLQTAGSTYSDQFSASGGGSFDVKFIEANGDVSKAIINTTTGSTDVKALEYLQTALDNGKKAYNATDKNNEIAAQQLEAWNKQLEKDRKYYESLRKPYRQLQGKTSLSYTPNETTEDETTNASTE